MLATLTLVGLTSITQAQPPEDTVQIIVKFKAPDNIAAAAAAQASDNITAASAAVQTFNNIAAIASAVQASHGKDLRDLPQLRTHVISVPASAAANVLANLENDPSVERAAKAIKFQKAGTPDDPLYTKQWALPKIAWDQVYGTTPITGSAIIAVLDTGVDAAHPDLAGRIGPGQSFVNGDANSDPNGHGTYLAGIAAANVNNATGVAGIAYDGVTVSSIQVLQPDGTGLDSDVIAGVVWAVDNGANVILMGFSSAEYSAALDDALQYAWSNGAVLVAATGNDGSSSPSYPAGTENVLGVASTDQYDSLAAYSNTGSACVAAPGVDIYTTMFGGDYCTINGTSAAAAETAGLAALLVASGQSNGYIYDQIRGAVDPITGQSFGRINVAMAMGEAVTPPPGPEPEPPPPPGPTPPIYAPAATITSTAAGGAWTAGGTWVGGVAPLATDSVVIATTGANTVTTGGSRTCVGLTINSGARLSMANGNILTVNGDVSGTGTWTLPTGGGNSATVNLTGDWSFSGTFNATNRLNVTASGSGDQTVTGTVTFRNFTIDKSGGTIFLTVTPTISNTFTMTAGDVSYNGGAQNVLRATYPGNLTFEGSGVKTMVGTVRVNGILSINSGATLDTGNYALTFAGDFVNNGTFTAGSSTITITGAVAQSIDGFTTTGPIIVTKTGGTATLTGNVNAASLSYTTAAMNGGTVSLNPGVAVTLTGAFSMARPASGATSGSVFAVNAGSLSCTTISLGGTNTGAARSTTLSISTGTVTASGNITSAGTYSYLTFTGAGTLNAGGTFMSGTRGTFTASTGTINFNAAGAQSIAPFAYTFNNVTLSGSGAKTTTGATVNGILSMEGTATTTGTAPTYNAAATLQYKGDAAQTTGIEFPATFDGSGGVIINNINGVTLNGSRTITATLTLTSGNITTGSYTVVIPSGGSVSRISGHVIGNLQKYIATGTNVSQTFEVGTISGYNLVAVTFGSVTTGDNMTAKATAGDHPSLGSSTINPGKSVNVYWTLTNSGISYNNYDATFNFNPSDIDSGANTNIFIVGNFNDPTWTYPSVGMRALISTEATGITSFGDFAVGEPLEFINFTIAYSGAGVTFGSLDPGIVDREADNQTATQGAVTLIVYPDTNVNVNIQLMGDNFTFLSSSIPIGNIKYNSNFTTLGASAMPDHYVTWYTVPASTDNTTECYLWITIPAGQAPGDPYTSKFYYQAIKQP